MARSLLDKHSNGGKRGDPNPNLKIITGGNQQNEERLTDADWYFINSFWDSSLFNKHYLRDDFQRSRASKLLEFETGFQKFLNQFLNLCDSRRDEKFYTWNEDQTIRSWIMPVMETLGWCSATTDAVIPELTYTISDGHSKRTFRPDCAFVPTPKLKAAIQEKSASQRLEYARRYVILTLEAKYWDRLRKFQKEDQQIGSKADLSKCRDGDSASSLSPGGQVLTYLKHLRNDDPVRNHFGIVTDGKVWRLHHVDHPENQFFEFDLGDLFFEITAKSAITELSNKQYRCIEEAARYFYYVFSKAVLFSETGEPTLVDELLLNRKRYISEAAPNLKNRFLNAMKFACNGFARAFTAAGTSYDLNTIRDVAESYIFNLLFLKSCEANGIIRYEANTDISITSVLERISYFDQRPVVDDETNENTNLAPRFKEFKYKNSGTDLHAKILRLTEVIQAGGTLDGKNDFYGFKETLFSDREMKLFSKHPLLNVETVKVLFELGYMKEDNKYRQIPYNIFTPEQLGSIYESFLDFTLSEADEDLEFANDQWLPISRQTVLKLKRHENVSLPLVQKGQLYFTPDNKERKVSGSFYTPDFIVKYIIENTLGPLCKNKSASEILELRICDPAMGSGHFLTGALRYLTDRYLEAQNAEPAARYRTPPQAKREILNSCIFGVDKNHRAVRLGKMALWLETAYAGRRLERLSDQIKVGDSLISNKKIIGEIAFDWKNEFPFLRTHLFDAVVGNPPYVFVRDKKISSIEKEYLGSNYKWSRYQLNIAQSFVELSFNLVVEDGLVGLILPNTWLTIQSSDYFREGLLQNSCELTVTNSLDKIFQDASVDNAIIVAKKKPNAEACVLTTQVLENSVFKAVSTARRVEPSRDIINCLTITGENYVETFSAIRSTVGSLYIVKSGLKAYEVGKGKPIQTKRMKDERVYHYTKKANSRCRKYLEGKDVKRYCLDWSGQYLEYGANLAAPRDSNLFCGPRVLIRQIPSKPPYCINAAVVTGEEVNDINSIIVKVTTVEDAYFLLAILNSKIVSEWFIQKFDKFQRKTFPQVKANELASFPIPAVSNASRTRLVSLASDISKMISERKSEKEIARLNAELDRAVEKAFKDSVKTVTKKVG